MKIAGKQAGAQLQPLEVVTLTEIASIPGGQIVVTDDLGREYVRQEAESELQFTVAGALGHHIIWLEDANGKVHDKLVVAVNTSTQVNDAGGFYSELLQMLQYTKYKEGWLYDTVLYNGRIYRYFVGWLRDHVHEMKGLKYFWGHLKEGIDVYRDSQREDGMIWDNIYPRDPQLNGWDDRFTEGGFIRPFDDHSAEFKRIPVENDVEYLFVEGLYYTWKAVGDDAWMASSLDAAIRAFDYTINSPYRWSEKYQLLKRGYTIDTWDFQNDFDSVVNNDSMRIDPDKTPFGVMFGDNTGYAAGCDYLAEMLSYVGRDEEAARFKQRGQEIRERLDALSWNGHFFTHHVPENSERKHDFGVDTDSQISLSNAYSLNRGITHEQSVAIIKSYQNVKNNLPAGSPGEWYTIYPIFQRGYGGHNGYWQYMNGGVTPIVAGELAHGAFEHGFESYGVDILQRLYHLGKKHGNRFHAAYTGAILPAPERTFQPLNIAPLANIDVAGTGAEGVIGWTGEGENDLHEAPSGRQVLLDIPFEIPDPATNYRRAAIGLSQRQGYATTVELEVHRKAASIHFLHTSAQGGPGGTTGLITLHYADGSSFNRYVVRGYNVQGWWIPPDGDRNVARVAWRGKNKFCSNVGLLAYGLDNPYPEREIDHITLSASKDGALWAILGITLGDQAVYFPPDPISYGIPDGWASSAVIYALIEGLVGVVDKATLYQKVALSPRWTATDVADVTNIIKYEDSGTYVAYRYQHDRERGLITLDLTGSGESSALHVLLPEGVKQVKAVYDGDAAIDFTQSLVEQSHYVDFVTGLNGLHHISIQYQAQV